MNVAVSTSGCGEHLVRTMFGRLCADAARRTDALGVALTRDVQREFLGSAFLRDIDAPMAGALAVRHDPASGDTDLFWLHTTRSMGVAYAAPGRTKAQVSLSRTQLFLSRVGGTAACRNRRLGPIRAAGRGGASTRNVQFSFVWKGKFCRGFFLKKASLVGIF